MSKLTADDIVDLGRWHFIQFKDEATAEAAMERYRRYIERQRAEAEAAGGSIDIADDVREAIEFAEAYGEALDLDDEAREDNEHVDDLDERAA